MASGCLRILPRDLRRALRQRYHPYLAAPISIDEMAAPANFEARVDAFDRFNHHTSSYIGLLRQYDAKRTAISQLCREMTEIEKKMVELHERMRQEGSIIADFLPFPSEITHELEEEIMNEEEDDDEDDHEVTVTPVTSSNRVHAPRPSTPPLPTSSSSSSSSSQVPNPPPPPPLYENVRIDEADVIISCVSRVDSTEGGEGSIGVRRRVYARPVPCTLCEEFFFEHFKCSNYRCKSRVCRHCFGKLESKPLICPYCRSNFDLTKLSNEERDRPPSPPF